MRHIVKCSLVALIGLSTTVSPLWTNTSSAAPSTLNYQAVLLDAIGAPVTTTTSVVFTIWDAALGGTPLWTETRNVTPDSDGKFTILLGETAALEDSVFASDDRWLSLKVGSDIDEVSPRTALASGPYALRVQTVDGAGGGTIDGSMNVDGGISTTSLNVRPSSPQASATRSTPRGPGLASAACDPTDTTIGVGGGFTNTNLGSANILDQASVSTAIGFCNWMQSEAGFVVGNENRLNLNADGSVIFGFGDTILAPGAFIVGTGNKVTSLATGAVAMGTDNTVSEEAAFAVGRRNTITNKSSIAMGTANLVSGQDNIVMGDSNQALGSSGNMSITGGTANKLESASNAHIGGGELNEISGAGASVIGGGRGNTINTTGQAETRWAVIAGGDGNTMTNTLGFIGGGLQNDVSGIVSSIVGGEKNEAHGKFNFIGGGQLNKIFVQTTGGTSGNFSAIGGGNNNTIGLNGFSASSFIGGGSGHSILQGGGNVIGGGSANSSEIVAGTIAGGVHNTLVGTTSLSSTIGGGRENSASGRSSTVPGGELNQAAADHSFAAGLQAKVRAGDHGTFVWADGTGIDFTSSGQNQFLIRAGGGVGIGSKFGDGVTVPTEAVDVDGIVNATGFKVDGMLLNPSASGLWSQSGSNTFYNAGNVGVGTDTPTEALEVDGNIRASDLLISGNSIVIDGASGIISSTTGSLEVHPESSFPTKSIKFVADSIGTSLVMKGGPPPLTGDNSGSLEFSVGSTGPSIMLHDPDSGGGGLDMIIWPKGLVMKGRPAAQPALELSIDSAGGPTIVMKGGPAPCDLELSSVTGGGDTVAINMTAGTDGSAALVFGTAGHATNGLSLTVDNDGPSMVLESSNGGSTWDHEQFTFASVVGSSTYVSADGLMAVSEDSQWVGGYRSDGIVFANAFNPDSLNLGPPGTVFRSVQGSAHVASLTYNASSLNFQAGSAGTALSIHTDGRVAFPSGGISYGLLSDIDHPGMHVVDSANSESMAYLSNGISAGAGRSGAFKLVAGAGIEFYADSTEFIGVALNPGAGSFMTASDRNLKSNFEVVNSQTVLEKVAAMPMTTWNYKSQDESIRHMGPMAQDFYTAFGLGTDDKHITTLDADGVALAAIQGLYELYTSTSQELTQANQEIQSLKSQLAQLQSAVEAILAQETQKKPVGSPELSAVDSDASSSSSVVR